LALILLRRLLNVVVICRTVGPLSVSHPEGVLIFVQRLFLDNERSNMAIDKELID